MPDVRRSTVFRWGFMLALFGLAAAPAYGQYGPAVTIWADGALFVKAELRDNETVGRDQLGAYLSRIPFKSTEKLTIKADQPDGKTTALKGKFELHLADRRTPKAPALLKITFDELRLMQSKTDRDVWFLTKEGIESIEKATEPKK